MRTLLTGALLAALALPGFAPDAHAHGGQYRGPGDSLPPGLREPHDPQPPPPPPPSEGPPSLLTEGVAGNGWECEHRWSTIMNMVQVQISYQWMASSK